MYIYIIYIYIYVEQRMIDRGIEETRYKTSMLVWLVSTTAFLCY